VAANGQVTAIDGAGGSRELRRRSEFYTGETIVTQPASFAQLRMTDSAIVSLNEATQFEIIASSYENPSQDDISTLRLIEGGFRTITGQIGEQNRDAYSVETEFATLGTRGTDFSSVIPIPLDPITGLALPATELIAGIFDGGATLAPALNIGIGADFYFARVSDPNSPPIGLTVEPAEIGGVASLRVTFSDDEDDGGDGGNADGTENTTQKFEKIGYHSEGGAGQLAEGVDAYWFIADPLDVIHLPGSGSLDYGGDLSLDSTGILALAETQPTTVGGSGLHTSSTIDLTQLNNRFNLTVDFNAPAASAVTGSFSLITANKISWTADFSGSITDSSLSMTVLGNANNIIEDVISTPVT
jgi:hypothetical protein